MLGARQFTSITTYKAGARPAVNNWDPDANNNIVIDPGANGQQQAPGVNIHSIEPIYPKGFDMRPDKIISPADVFKPTNVDFAKVARRVGRKFCVARGQYKRQFSGKVKDLQPGDNIVPCDGADTADASTGTDPNYEATFETSTKLDENNKPTIDSKPMVTQTPSQPVISNLGFERGYETGIQEVINFESVGQLFGTNSLVSQTFGDEIDFGAVRDFITGNPRITSVDRNDLVEVDKEGEKEYKEASVLRTIAESLGAAAHKLSLGLEQFHEPISDFQEAITQTPLSNNETGTRVSPSERPPTKSTESAFAKKRDIEKRLENVKRKFENLRQFKKTKRPREKKYESVPKFSKVNYAVYSNKAPQVK